MTWWKRRDERLSAEMREHIEFETQENISAGMTPEEGRREALRKFGSVTLAREESITEVRVAGELVWPAR